jgi:hypothetical protein
MIAPGLGVYRLLQTDDKRRGGGGSGSPADVEEWDIEASQLLSIHIRIPVGLQWL